LARAAGPGGVLGVLGHDGVGGRGRGLARAGEGGAGAAGAARNRFGFEGGDAEDVRAVFTLDGFSGKGGTDAVTPSAVRTFGIDGHRTFLLEWVLLPMGLM
jgi:hypothetical protein